jgi:hypothetical protein
VTPLRNATARAVALAVTLVLAATLGACSHQLTVENYDALKAGMTLEQVEALLGSGELVEGGSAAMDRAGVSGGKFRWTEGDREVTVHFFEGRLRSRTKYGF